MKSKVTYSGLVSAAFLSLLVQGGEAQGQPDRAVNPLTSDPRAAAAGKRVFEAVCTACHGASGSGTERAPAFNTRPFKHGNEDSDLLQTIQQGVPGTQMPAFGSLKAEEIWQLVSYVRSLSGAPATASAAASDLPAGDAARGEQLFFGTGQCTACHSVNGRGVPLAADLSEAGKLGAARLATAIGHPAPPRRNNQQGGLRWVDAVLTDGKVLTGIVRGQDSFSLVLQTADSAPHLLKRDAVRSVTPSAHPLTPPQGLQAAQKADLVAYLAARTERTPAAAPADPAAARHGLTYERLTHADREPQSWLTYWGNYAGEHFSELKEITPANVSRLQARWAVPMPGSSPLESTPLVVDGIMYVSGQPGDVYALDARTGLTLWKYHRAQDRTNPFQINPYNRGVAVLGQRVFFNTLDDNLIALDVRTGTVLWEQHLADTMQGYSMTGAPLALADKVIVGISGGEMGVRGFIAAFSAADGHEVWRFNTIPGPGEPGHDTWSGDSWKTGSGATWLTGSYDPGLHLLYWAVGNPGPDYDPSQRAGDNLYSCSVLALDPDTGRLVWHYQMTPHDSHDWDAEEDMILADEVIGGQTRHVMLQANRNGFFYTLDRATGKFISAVPFVRQTWNQGFEANGRPITDPASVATPEGRRISPGVGGTNFQPPSYDRQNHVLYLNYIESEGSSSYQPAHYQPGQSFTGSHFVALPGPATPPSPGIMALDTRTGQRLWTFPLQRPSLQAGVLGTRGGVVLAASAEGNLIGLEARSGKALWHFQTGTSILAAPISYAVDGKQTIAIAAGNTLYSFALPEGR